MANQDEKKLVEKAREGDRTAFGELVRAHHRRAYGLAIHLLANKTEADDVVQDAFLRAFRAIDRFDGRSEFGTWLHRIVVNLCLNALRSRKRTAPVSADDPRLASVGADPARGADARRRFERLAAAIDGLSLTLRTTVVLVTIQGMSHKDAAGVLGCSEGTVAWRVHEARRRLREALGEAEKPAAKEDSPGKDESDEG
jgi:RNA polymerase sigma-70 factor (ECF subfamily)